MTDAYPDLVVAYILGGGQRWLPAWWVRRLLVGAGAQRSDARAAVDDAHATVGRRIASRRVLPVWVVKVMLAELRTDLGEV